MPHQDIEEDLLEVFCVLISQPTCILFSPFSARTDNFDLNFPWKGTVMVVKRGRLGASGFPAPQVPS
jgi:hypothetical protein